MMSGVNGMNQKQLLKKIGEVSFAIDDMLLFLDTHPKEEKALRFMREQSVRRRELVSLYEKQYGPLTKDGNGAYEKRSWQWIEQPFPWEQEGGCR